MESQGIKVDNDRHIAQMGFWDQLATWIGANANNGTWYIGGVIAALGLSGALGVILISGPLAYVFLALVGYMGYKVRASTMNLMRPAFGVRGSIGPSLINVVQFMGWQRLIPILRQYLLVTYWLIFLVRPILSPVVSKVWSLVLRLWAFYI